MNFIQNEDGSVSIVNPSEVLGVSDSEWKEIQSAFCSCGNPSGESEFHEDEFEDGVRVSKHHYTCCDCGKITQVG